MQAASVRPDDLWARRVSDPSSALRCAPLGVPRALRSLARLATHKTHVCGKPLSYSLCVFVAQHVLVLHVCCCRCAQVTWFLREGALFCKSMCCLLPLPLPLLLSVPCRWPSQGRTSPVRTALVRTWHRLEIY